MDAKCGWRQPIPENVHPECFYMYAATLQYNAVQNDATLTPLMITKK